MEVVAKRHQDQLERIKKSVKETYEGFRHNYDRFNEFRRFFFETSLSDDDITLLTTISMPQLEFNSGEAHISRLLGEFAKQEPAVSVSAEDQDRADPVTVHVVEQHLRHIILDTKNYSSRYEVMKDLYSGGFSCFKVWTDYANSMSFDQVIEYDRVYDPTLVGFDPLARQPHKGDGRFCFQLFPMDKETFEQDYPDVDISRLDFTRRFSGFNWAYINETIPIVLVCDYYEKKSRKVKIVQLADKRVMTLKEYEAMSQNWGSMEQLPAVMGKPRWTTLETICRYRCIDNKVIEYSETDFTYFPLIFVHGNSVILKNPKTTGNVKEFTRPYLYHARGAQKLKNFSGITLANEIENLVKHKFMVAKEALPKEQDWLQAYKDIQKPSTLVYNAFFEQDPDKPIPNPIQPVQRMPIPPEVIQTFTSTDSLMQNILGSYDAALGINDNQLSGKAIIEGASHSNSAAMPYVVGFLQGLQRLAEVFVDLIPKYYVTPRTIPIRSIDGKRDYVKINQEDGVPMFYDTNALNVKVEAGVSFQVQKSQALQQLISLQQVSPLFAEFMNTKGLPVLLDNLEIRGIDQLKLMVDEWLQELEQQKQMAMMQQQQEMQNNQLAMRNQIEMMKLKQKSDEADQKREQSQRQAMIDEDKIRLEEMKVIASAMAQRQNSRTQMLKANTERYAKELDLVMKQVDMRHRHGKERAELHHKVNTERREARA